MDSFKKVGLTDEELQQGKLSAIMNAIRQDHRELVQNVAFLGNSGKQVYAQIFFENNLEYSFYEKYPNESDVLYVNEPAMFALNRNQVPVRILGTATELPQGYGNVISLPILVN